MTFTRRQALLALAATASTVAARAADKFPSRPITIVVPFPPGGVVDRVGRLLGDKLSAGLGAPVIVQNKPGAGGTLGAAYVAKAAPDGYTLLLGGAATQVFDPILYKHVEYDATRDFAYVGQISSGPLVLVTGSKVAATDVPQLVAWLKERGNRASFASNGNGTFPHLVGELFKQTNGLASVHIPYSGGAAALTALIRGDVDFSINHIPVIQGMVKSGKLRALATTGAKRSAVFPNLPTLEEEGMKGLEANAWFGLLAPAATPPAVVDRCSTALATALKDPGVQSALIAQGDEVDFRGPNEFRQYVEAETAKWGNVVKSAHLQLS